jgi:hypothetical protein
MRFLETITILQSTVITSLNQKKLLGCRLSVTKIIREAPSLDIRNNEYKTIYGS